MITAQWLRDTNLDKRELLRFIKQFPDGFVVTEESCVAHALDFDWKWLAERTLPHYKVEEFIHNSIKFQRDSASKVMSITGLEFHQLGRSECTELMEQELGKRYEFEAKMYARLFD